MQPARDNFRQNPSPNLQRAINQGFLEERRAKANRYLLWIAIALVALYVGAGGAAKLAGVPYVHSSFLKLGLPAWFGYFIGACEVLGPIGLLIRPLRALAALGIGLIMIGATYYHAVYTPALQALPAFVLTILCAYIFLRGRTDILNFDRAQRDAGAAAGRSSSGPAA